LGVREVEIDTVRSPIVSATFLASLEELGWLLEAKNKLFSVRNWVLEK